MIYISRNTEHGVTEVLTVKNRRVVDNFITFHPRRWIPKKGKPFIIKA